MIECPYCLEARPWTGTDNIFRHLLLEHPDSERGRLILRILASRPLPRPEVATPRLPLAVPAEHGDAVSGGGADLGGRSPSHHSDAA